MPTQAIINHAARLELCPKISVERFKVVKREKEPATWEWIQAFMAHANPHLGALSCFMFLTGARITEALSVTWDDVDLHAGKALIRQTKVGSERRAHLPPVLVAAIANIPDRHETVFKHTDAAECRSSMARSNRACWYQAPVLPCLPPRLCDGDAPGWR